MSRVTDQPCCWCVEGEHEKCWTVWSQVDPPHVREHQCACQLDNHGNGQGALL